MEEGRWPEALSEARIALQLDPLSVWANDNLSAILYFSGEYDQCIEQCLKTLRVDPMSHQAHRHLGQAYAQKRLNEQAIKELNKAFELSHGSSEALAELGYVLAVSGSEDKAHGILQQLMYPAEGHVSQYRVAIVYIGLGQKDKAMESLESAVKDRSPGVVHLKVSPLFLELRSDPRFQQLLRDIGLPGETR